MNIERKVCTLDFIGEWEACEGGYCEATVVTIRQASYLAMKPVAPSYTFKKMLSQ